MRRVLVSAAVLAASLTTASAAFACGEGGYTYAGMAAGSRAFGIAATVTPLSTPSIAAGDVAGWVGVGGPHEGPGGADEWLQVGFNVIGGIDGANLYYEVARAGSLPAYHLVAANVPAGRPTRVAVLEMRDRPTWWRVWVDGAPASAPIHLRGSHGRWAPIATAESWDGAAAGGVCNAFLYRFHRIAIAHAPGGAWTALSGGYPITSASTRLQRSRTSASFLAAQGESVLRSFASFSP